MDCVDFYPIIQGLVDFSDDAVRFFISECSIKAEGVDTFIRIVFVIEDVFGCLTLLGFSFGAMLCFMIFLLFSLVIFHVIV